MNSHERGEVVDDRSSDLGYGPQQKSRLLPIEEEMKGIPYKMSSSNEGPEETSTDIVWNC